MTTLKKNAIAVALVAAMGFAANASAYDVLTNGNAAPEPVAQQLGTVVTMTENVSFTIALGDNIIGRTTGFGIKITLLDGAQFNAAMPATLLPGTALQGAWNINLAAGGIVGGTVVQYSAGPGAAGDFVKDGDVTSLVALALKNVSTTGQTRMRVELIDPVTGNTLNNGASTFDKTQTIIVRTDGLAFTCAATANANRIDVGSNATYASKTGFVPFPYVIGGANTDLASLGLITVATTGGFTLNVAAGGDTLFSQVIGTDLSSFDAIFLGDATCAVNYGTYTVGTGAAANTATLDEEFAVLNAAGATFIATGGAATLCVDVDGASSALGTQALVQSQQFAVVNGINATAEADACVVAPVAYNGSVVKVETFNPDGNSTAQSFVRITNPGTISGKVTITGRDDAGVAGASPFSFNLAAGKSVQINSTDLELGSAKGTGAFGDGTGKWHLVVTGEFAGMRVASLNRNSTDGTVTNLTDYDTNQEQSSTPYSGSDSF